MLKDWLDNKAEERFWGNYQEELDISSMDALDREVRFKDLGESKDILDLLKSIAKGDKTRYFNAPSEEKRLRIKGEYLRTIYLIRQAEASIKEVKDSEEPPITGEKLFNKRYGI